MGLIDIKIAENFPDFDVQNFLLIINNTDDIELNGFHAHKNTNQIIVCTRGRIYVSGTSGRGDPQQCSRTVVQIGDCMFIKKGTWCFQEYDPNSSSVVLADLPYDEEDYIRNYQEFLKFSEEDNE